MKFLIRYRTRRLMRGCITGSIGLLLFCAGELAAQSAAIDVAVIANGGDMRSEDYGEIFSTIGEPFAADEVKASDDETTWTGFWQVLPLPPEDTTMGVEEYVDLSASGATGVSAMPNPFSSDLDITVRLQSPGMVRLVAYDMVGRPARVLLEGRREAGTIRLAWKPDGLESGSYILRLTVDGNELPAQLVRYYR